METLMTSPSWNSTNNYSELSCTYLYNLQNVLNKTHDAIFQPKTLQKKLSTSRFFLTPPPKKKKKKKKTPTVSPKKPRYKVLLPFLNVSCLLRTQDHEPYVQNFGWENFWVHDKLEKTCDFFFETAQKKLGREKHPKHVQPCPTYILVKPVQKGGL